MPLRAKNMPVIEWVKQYFDYEPETGIFTWKNPTCIAEIKGRAAGTPDKGGYLRMRCMGVRFFAHRAAWAWVHGDWPPENMQVDHINGNPADNRICNLRLADNAQQQMNLRRRKVGVSGLRGVVRDNKTGYWRAQLMHNKRSIYLGTFKDKAEARAAYLVAARERFGEFVIDSGKAVQS